MFAAYPADCYGAPGGESIRSWPVACSGQISTLEEGAAQGLKPHCWLRGRAQKPKPSSAPRTARLSRRYDSDTLGGLCIVRLSFQGRDTTISSPALGVGCAARPGSKLAGLKRSEVRQGPVTQFFIASGGVSSQRCGAKAGTCP